MLHQDRSPADSFRRHGLPPAHRHPAQPGEVIGRTNYDWQEPLVLLVEDDPADALLVEELASDSTPGLRLRWARSMAQARAEFRAEVPDCVLLDLNLPDAHGLGALAQVHEFADQVAVVVLTGLSEPEAGLAAVGAGAQDYLVKGRVDPELLGRAVRYAIQRKQAERTSAALQANQMQARENARLERGLLPTPLLRPTCGVEVVARYRPGRAHALLGGDFYDIVQTDDGAIHTVVGDVSGHGPDEAAIGVALRIAWRTLVLGGITGTPKLRLLEEVLVAERADPTMFATLTTVILSPSRTKAKIMRVGHPGILVRRGSTVDWVEVPGCMALGLLPGRAEWLMHEIDITPDTGLMLFTDGLFEGHAGEGMRRLGEEGLLELARGIDPAASDEAFVDELISRAEALAESHGGLADDVAAVHLRWAADPTEDQE